MHVVRELVRQDHLDFVVRVLRQQRIRQQDPPRAAEAGERGIRLPGAVAQSPLEDTEHARPGAIGQTLVVLTPIEQSIVRTLEGLNAAAARSYQQAVVDLGGQPRHSYRGVAHELREALRETLDHFAPDADVMAEAGFQLEKGLSRPTHRQKALYVLRKRRVSAGARRAPEEAVAMVEELGASIARSTYTRGTMSAHGQASGTEVRQMKMYVDAVLAELLEVHKE